MSDTGSIEGKVLNQQDGKPIAGASLHLTGEGVTEESSTGADGAYAFDGLAPGHYELLVRKEGFEDGVYGPLVVMAGHPTNVDVALQPRSD